MSNFPSSVFQKSCIVQPDGTIKFTHGEKDFHLTAECLQSLKGMTVLVNSGMELFRSDHKIGNAVSVR